MNAYREVGIRAAVAPLVEDQHRLNALILAENPDLSREVYGVSPPLSADEYLDLLDDFFQAWHLKHDGRLRCLAGPSGVQWCSDRLLVGSIELAERYDTGFHMHVEETKLHAVACRDLLGRSAVAHLAELGVLKERASLAHCVWIDDDDIERIVEADTTVVHNPVCNLKLGSGFAPILEILGRGGRVALACDGAASNDSQIMFESMKTAGLMHTVRSPDHRRWVSARRIFQMATVDAARVLRLQGDLGSIHCGRPILTSGSSAERHFGRVARAGRALEQGHRSSADLAHDHSQGGLWSGRCARGPARRSPHASPGGRLRR